MPEPERVFEAFVTNLDEYNNNELVGEWVKFPTTQEELSRICESIGVDTTDEHGQPYKELFITDYDCPAYYAKRVLGEYESLDKLNYLAALIEDLPKYDQDKLSAIVAGGCDKVNNIDDLINLTFNLDCYGFVPDATDDYSLGYYYVHEIGIYSSATRELGMLSNYIDYESLGRDIAFDQDGHFTDEGYVCDNWDKWEIQFDGTLEDIPDKYRITGGNEEKKQETTLTAVVVEPEKKPEIKEIGSSLEDLQALVGGYIQAVYPYDDPVAIVCNEEAKLSGLPLNRALRDENGEIYDVLAGTFAVVGLTDDSFGSLDSGLAEKYSKLFEQPEQFAILGDKVVAIPMISEEQQKQEAKEATVDTDELSVVGYYAMWHPIDQREVGGHTFFLMEHNDFGNEKPCVIIDEEGKLSLTDVYDGFDEHTVSLLELEVMTVDRMPDETISVDDMKEYGYSWGGMLPMREETASEVGKENTIYRLYGDNTESRVTDLNEVKEHAAKGGIFGIEKTDWMAVLEKENHLKNAEVSLEDDYGMIDGIINNGKKDEKSEEKGGKTSIMDRLKSAKSDIPKEKATPQKERKPERDI